MPEAHDREPRSTCGHRRYNSDAVPDQIEEQGPVGTQIGRHGLHLNRDRFRERNIVQVRQRDAAKDSVSGPNPMLIAERNRRTLLAVLIVGIGRTPPTY